MWHCVKGLCKIKEETMRSAMIRCLRLKLSHEQHLTAMRQCNETELINTKTWFEIMRQWFEIMHQSYDEQSVS